MGKFLKILEKEQYKIYFFLFKAKSQIFQVESQIYTRF